MYGPDTMEDIAKDVIPDDFFKAELLLQVKRGCKVMLTSNLNPSRGLCNGSCGKVYDVLLDENNEVEYIFVQFDDFEGEGFMGIDKLVPIKREKRVHKPETGKKAHETYWKAQFDLTLG